MLTDCVLFAVMYNSGARVSEAIRLQRVDLDLTQHKPSPRNDALPVESADGDIFTSRSDRDGVSFSLKRLNDFNRIHAHRFVGSAVQMKAMAVAVESLLTHKHITHGKFGNSPY